MTAADWRGWAGEARPDDWREVGVEKAERGEFCERGERRSYMRDGLGAVWRVTCWAGACTISMPDRAVAESLDGRERKAYVPLRDGEVESCEYEL